MLLVTAFLIILLLFYLVLGVGLLLRETFQWGRLRQNRLAGTIPSRISLFFGLASVIGLVLTICGLAVGFGWEPPWIERTPEVRSLDVKPSNLSTEQEAKVITTAWDAKGRPLQFVWGATGGTIRETGYGTAEYIAPDREGSYYVLVKVVADGQSSKDSRRPVTVSKDKDKVSQSNESFNKGLSAFEIADYPTSIRELSNSLAATPNFYDAFLLRGTVFKGMGYYPEALSDYTAAISLIPDYEPSYLLRADAYLRSGDSLQAVSDIEQVLAFTKDPQYIKLLDDFAALATDSERFARLRAALQISPVPFLVGAP